MEIQPPEVVTIKEQCLHLTSTFSAALCSLHLEIRINLQSCL